EHERKKPRNLTEQKKPLTRKKEPTPARKCEPAVKEEPARKEASPARTAGLIKDEKPVAKRGRKKPEEVPVLDEPILDNNEEETDIADVEEAETAEMTSKVQPAPSAAPVELQVPRQFHH